MSPARSGRTLTRLHRRRVAQLAACRVARASIIVSALPSVASVSPTRRSGFTYKPPPFEPEVFDDIDVELDQYTGDAAQVVDVAIAGAGPAGLATAARIASQGLSVVVVDPNPLAHWPNNYGVWTDEFEAMALDDCFETTWSRANVWLGESDERFLARPYARVDRRKLKAKLVGQCIEHRVQFHRARVDKVFHTDRTSLLTCMDHARIEARLVVDATGHARRLTKMDGEHNPGYQVAYGIMADVESHPFDLDTMLFMDWRDAHLNRYPVMKDENVALPTFLYAMPFSKTRVFLEETSLVARPGIPFDLCKERLYARLEHYGIKVHKIVEEEYCLIPMGGVLPERDQRVVGCGGTAGLVHPSTGYMVARTLAAVPQLADRIVDELSMPASAIHVPEGVDPMVARSQRIWESIWPIERLQQREFKTFGMEVLLKLDLYQTREFFSAFFALSDFHWRGFLSSQLSFSELFVFGLALFAKASNDARANLLMTGAPLLPTMAATIATLPGTMPQNSLGKGGSHASPVATKRPAAVARV